MMVLGLILLLCGNASELDHSKGFVGQSGDFLSLVGPYSTGAFALGRGDRKPALQFSEAYVASLATALLLKKAVHRCRPDGSNDHSFPSGHTASAFAAAMFLQRQYGSKVGVPALAVAGYVGWTRTKVRKHWWTDVLAGAAISVGTNLLLVREPKVRK